MSARFATCNVHEPYHVVAPFMLHDVVCAAVSETPIETGAANDSRILRVAGTKEPLSSTDESENRSASDKAR